MEERHGHSPPKPLLLWFDYSFTPQEHELQVLSATHFRIHHTNLPSRALDDVAEMQPNALCFEFDHLDAARAEALQDVLREYPRLPALMLTVEHSEALAIWAFRKGVWNYLVKPVQETEFLENLDAFSQVALRGAAPRMPRPPGVISRRDLAVSPADARLAQLEPALRYVRRHFAEKVSEVEAARRCGMKRFAFSHDFHAVFGLTFRDYLMETRIDEARRMLVEGARPVTEIAFATGFTDGSHFARMFRRHTGQLPSRYRESAAVGVPAP